MHKFDKDYKLVTQVVDSAFFNNDVQLPVQDPAVIRRYFDRVERLNRNNRANKPCPICKPTQMIKTKHWLEEGLPIGYSINRVERELKRARMQHSHLNYYSTHNCRQCTLYPFLKGQYSKLNKVSKDHYTANPIAAISYGKEREYDKQRKKLFQMKYLQKDFLGYRTMHRKELQNFELKLSKFQEFFAS
ncbi:hypothetical protein SNEBB_008993 [Seison nebaliae]|nr:hypothetical protein SNEBB_008993 [Seison nebaliae]